MIRRMGPRTFRTLLLVLMFTFLAGSSHAQPREDRALHVAAGLGLSSPYDRTKVRGIGAFVATELSIPYSAWVGVRPYGAIILTWPDKQPTECGSAVLQCEVTARAIAVGGKGRLALPIPYVAPFLELGIGASAGAFETRTPKHQLTRSGLLVHIPVTLGVALGPEGEVEFKFTYLYHPAAKQFGGAVALGIGIPLESSPPEERPPFRLQRNSGPTDQ